MRLLPIPVKDLIKAKTIENSRLEYKKTYNQVELESALRTICAFANDFHNLNGGYVLFGVQEQEGRPVLPPFGLDDKDLDKIQKEIQGNCERIEPAYQPIISPEPYQDRTILVIWAPGGDNRPYKAPISLSKNGKSEKKFYIRLGSSTKIAKGQNLNDLLSMTASIPFDDRRYVHSTVSSDALSPVFLRKFLSDIHSSMSDELDKLDHIEICNRLRLLVRINEHYTPRNIALLLFSNDPTEYFPGAKGEIAQFADETGGDIIEENVFKGPIQEQIKQVLEYLNNLSRRTIKKVPGIPEVQKTVQFPYEAMEEAIVNAYYHRSYESYEPTKIYLYPDRMEIISYPGPVPGIKPEHLQEGARVPPVQNRNRRIGDFLKELRLAEGRGTGIPKIYRKMSENGSPPPIFEFDDDRTYFMVTLPAHPQYIVMNALREGGRLWAIGERKNAIQHLEEALKRVPESGAILAQIINYKVSTGDFKNAEDFFKLRKKQLSIQDGYLAYMEMAKAYINNKEKNKARQILNSMPAPLDVEGVIDLAVLHKRTGALEEAHRIFSSNYSLISNDPKALHEFAQTNIKLASKHKDYIVKKRLDREALEILHRVIQLSDDNIRNAWCWYDIARASKWLKKPKSDIIKAIDKAIGLLPFEQKFKKWKRENTNG